MPVPPPDAPRRAAPAALSPFKPILRAMALSARAVAIAEPNEHNSRITRRGSAFDRPSAAAAFAHGSTDNTTTGRLKMNRWFRMLAAASVLSTASISFGQFLSAQAVAAGVAGVTHETSAIVAVDFDGDGDTDLVVANRSTGQLILLENDGMGGFMQSGTIPTGRRPASIAAADLNGDMVTDLAVAIIGDDQVAVLLGNGSGFGLPTTFMVGDSPLHVAIGDIDGANGLDLITSNESEDTLSVLLNDGNGMFAAAIQVDVSVMVAGQPSRSEPNGSTTGDFNKDNKTDLAVALAFRDQIGVLLGNGDGTFQAMVRVDVGGDPTAITAADLNGDTNPDLAVANTTGDSISILLGDGTGAYSVSATLTGANNPEAIIAADADDDGDLDIVTANREGDDVTIFPGDGAGGFGAASSLATGGAPSDVVASDLNGDMETDIATANQEGNLVMRDDVSVLLAGEAVVPDITMMDCGMACGPLGMLPLMWTMLGMAGMKRVRRRNR
jgi:hypothetical protein